MNDHTLPLVSIIIPVYNVERYLRDCLDSVINQSLSEIEVICVNDGSTDGSLAILTDYAGIDSRIKIINKKNEGQAKARNLALSLTRGRYIAFVDSDDCIDRDLCRKAFEHCEMHECDVLILDFATFKSRSDRSSNRELSKLNSVDSADRNALLAGMGVVWTKFISAAFVRDNKICFPEGRIYEDIFVHWQLITLAKNLKVLPEKLYHYRIRPSATTYRTDRQISDAIFVFDSVRRFLEIENEYETYKAEFLRSQLNVFVGVYDSIDASYKDEVMSLIRDRLVTDHWIFIESSPLLNWKVKDFFREMRGSQFARFRRRIWFTARSCYRGLKMRSSFFRISPVNLNQNK